jgi:hypothetical protein
MAFSVATSPNAARCCALPPTPAKHGLLPLGCLRLQAMSTAAVAYGELDTLAHEKLRSDPAANEHVRQHHPLGTRLCERPAQAQAHDSTKPGVI